MDWQLVLVVAFLTLASIYLSRRLWRSLSGASSGCQGKCDCGKPTTAVALQQLGIRNSPGRSDMDER